MRIIDEVQLDFDDVLIQPKRSDLNSRSEVNIFRTFSKCKRSPFSCIPVCCANMGGISNITTAKIFARKGFLCALEKHISKDDIISLYKELQTLEDIDKVEPTTYTNRIAISIGINDDLDDPVYGLFPIINIDVANGCMEKLQDRVKEVREKYPNSWIIAGTVVTGDIVTDLLKCGADIIRCGIGGGAMCLSRLVAGVGRPMVSMLQECSDAAHQIHGYVMSDGGCKYPGDICKALGCADFVMVGSMFSGCTECDGEVVIKDGVKYRKFAGMSSEYAQNKYFGGFKSEYRSSEGRQKLVLIKDNLEDVINHICGGIRSCMTYIGCHNMKHMQKHMVFYKVNRQLNMSFDNKLDF